MLSPRTVKFKILGSVFLIASIISCTKDLTVQKIEIEKLSNATQQAIKSETLINLKQSVSMLSGNERQLLWDTKWDAILKNDADKLTSTQVKIIRSIKNFVDKVTIASLLIDPTRGELFIKNNLPYFENNFSKAQLYMLIECPYFCNDFSIFKSINYLTEIDPKQKINNHSTNYVSPVGGTNCECYYSLYCSIGGGGGGVCDTGITCNKVTNCGLTGTSNCTGRCSAK